MEADTDRFWQHRFERICTLWAGTADHALSNWAGHESIWDHFDEHHIAACVMMVLLARMKELIVLHCEQLNLRPVSEGGGVLWLL